jgi:hypothetical protein
MATSRVPVDSTRGASPAHFLLIPMCYAAAECGKLTDLARRSSQEGDLP